MVWRSWERWAPLFGVVAVILWILSFAVGGSSPDTSDSAGKITSYYASHSNQVKQIASFFLFLAAVLAFIVFLSALRSRLLAAEGHTGRLAALAYGAGLTSAVLFVAAIAAFAAPAFTANDTAASNLDPNTFRLMNDFGYELFVAAVIAGAVLVWTASAVAMRTGVFTRWFAWLGVLVGVILLFAVFFVPIFVYWGWIVVAAALLVFWRGARPAEPTPPPLTERR